MQKQVELDNARLCEAADKLDEPLTGLIAPRAVVARLLVGEEAATRPVEDEGLEVRGTRGEREELGKDELRVLETRLPAVHEDDRLPNEGSASSKGLRGRCLGRGPRVKRGADGLVPHGAPV